MQKVKKIKQPKIKQKSDNVELPSYDKRYMLIYEKSQLLDPLKEWKLIKDWIEENPTTISEIRNLIKQHANMSARSKRLVNVAETELRMFELRCRDRKQIWRLAAMAELEKEKENKTITKQITEKMVDDWVIEQHCELYTELETKIIRLKEVYNQIKSLASTVNTKGQDLRRLLDAEMKRPSGIPNWIDDKDQ